MTKSVFVIREKNTGTFLYTTKTRMFIHDLAECAKFARRSNAEKVIRGMFPKNTVNKYGGDRWSVENPDGVNPKRYFDHGMQEYIEILEDRNVGGHFNNQIEDIRKNFTEKKCEMEVVEVILTYTING